MAKPGMKRVFSNRNVLVISLTNAIATFFNQIYMPYWALYLQDSLGLELWQIGLLRSLQRSQNLLFTFPGGILADRIGRKKVSLMGAIARIGTSAIYLFAGNYELLLIGTTISALQSISNSAFSAMVAESLPRDQMGTGYGVFEMMRRVPLVFTGITGGFLIDYLGLTYAMHIFFLSGLIGGIVMFFSRFFFLKETLRRTKAERRSLRDDLKEVIPMFQGSLKYMQVTSAIYQFAAGLTSELLIIYVIDYIGLTSTEWGLILTTMSTVSLITSLPGGMMADKYDRVKLNVVARSIYPLTTLGYMTWRSFWLVLGTRMIAGIGMGLSGAAEQGIIGGSSWNSLMADLVPSEKRGRFSGLMSTFNGIVAFPAPFIGAYMWEIPSIGPEKTFWTQIILGLVSTLVFGKFVKDPRYMKKQEKEALQLREDAEEDSTKSG